MIKNLLKKTKDLVKEIKPIDYFFILAVIVAAGFFIYRFSRSSETVYVDLTYVNEGYGREEIPPKHWEVMQLEKGDVGFNNFGEGVAEIVEVEEAYWGNGERHYIHLTVKLDAIYNSANKNYLYQGNPLFIGNELDLNFGKTNFTGVITNIYESPEDRFMRWDRANAVLKLTAEDVKPWHAEALSNFTIDSKDFPVKTLESEISPALKVIKTDDGNLVKTLHPINKDVKLTLKLNNVLCKHEVCMYRYNVPLAVGSVFYADAGYVYLPPSSVEALDIIYLD